MCTISIRLMNIENNMELLDKIVWKPFLNVAMVPYHDGDTIEYISKEQPLTELLFDSGLKELSQQEMRFLKLGDCIPLQAVTNSKGYLGAALMINKENLDLIHESFAGNFWILPSSVHEFMILPDEGDKDAAELLNIVTEINSTIVSDDDKLSDSVYYYDGEKIIVCAHKEAR